MRLELPVHLTAMSNGANRDDVSFVVYRVDDPVVAYSKSKVRTTLQSFRLRWILILTKRPHTPTYPPRNIRG